MNIPARWLEVLRALRSNGFPEAIIAGGALRDIEHGRDVKDVDIFVRTHGEKTGDDLAAVFGYVGHALVEIGTTNEYETWTSSVVAVYDFPNSAPTAAETTDFDDFYLMPVVGPTIQVIVMDVVEKGDDFAAYIMDDFDIGLCKIYHDGDDLWRSVDYLMDVKRKTLTVTKAPSAIALERTKERIERLQKKYPEFEARDVFVRIKEDVL